MSNKKEDLPKQSLQIDAESLRRIDQSRIKKSIVSIILMMRKVAARQVSILSWDLEEESRYFGQILSLALGQQIEQKCALMITEGLKSKIDVFPSFTLITLPEVENTHVDEETRENFERTMRNFPVQVLAGPALSRRDVESLHSFKLACQSDAQILLVKSSGASRDTVERIKEITDKHKITWLCVIPVDFMHKRKAAQQ